MKEYLKKFFLEPLLRHRRWIVAAMVSLGLLSAAQSLFIVLVGPFLKAIFADGGQDLTLCSMLPGKWVRLAPFCDVHIDSGTLAVALPLAIVGAGWLKAGGSYLFLYSQEVLATAVSQSYRFELFKLIIAQPYSRFRRKSVGEWMSVIMNDVSVIQGRFSDVTTSFVRDLVLIVAALTAVCVINWRVGLIVTTLAPLGAAALGRAAVRIAWYAEQFQRRLAATAGLFLNLRARFAMIRAQHGEGLEFRRFDRLLRDYYSMIRRSLVLRSMMGPGMEFAGFCLFAAFLWQMTRSGELTPGKALAPDGVQLIVALGLLLRPLRNIGEQLTKLQEIRGALRVGYEAWCEIAAPTAGRPGDRRKGEPGERLPELVTIKGLRVSYGKGVDLQLGGVQLRRGQSYAIIGPSGAGKSSFVRVLAGLVDPEQFESDVELSSLQRHVAFVSQEPFFFQGSLRDNLLYGLEGGRVDDHAIREALRQVNISEELVAPDGSDLDRPYRGLHGGVSGGQLQRLVLARELLRGKDIWVLDEPTSAIDARSERDITERLIGQAKEQGKILIVVTHRLQWLQLFDQVMFFERGLCRAAGTCTEVLQDPRIRSFVEGNIPT